MVPSMAPKDDSDRGWTSGIGATHFDDGTPRKKCNLCGYMDGWHSGSCDNADWFDDALDMVAEAIIDSRED